MNCKADTIQPPSLKGLRSYLCASLLVHRKVQSSSSGVCFFFFLSLSLSPFLFSLSVNPSILPPSSHTYLAATRSLYQ